MGKLIEKISKDLFVKKKTLKMISYNANNYYRKSEIPKRKGGTRTIYLPNPTLKLIQHYITEMYLSNGEFSDFGYAYSKGKSIKENAQKHIGNKHFLFLDIKDFFNNISTDVLKPKVFHLFDNSEKDFNYFKMFCSYHDMFVQGAVSSPMISNLYMCEFDNKINDAVKEFDGVYTRYSDDITISAKNMIPNNFVAFVNHHLEPLKLTLNNEKSYYTSYLPEIEITGLKIVKGEISLSTKKKKIFKKRLYMFLTDRSEESLEQIIGLLNYINDVEPEFYKKLVEKYKI